MPIKFDGELLGSSSSEARGNARWTDISVYADNDTGGYLVSRVGRSLVVHDGPCGNFKPASPPVHLLDYHVACTFCEPPSSPSSLVYEEVQRQSAQECPDAWTTIDALRLRSKEDDAWFVPTNSALALRMAANHDDKIRDALRKSMRTRWSW